MYIWVNDYYYATSPTHPQFLSGTPPVIELTCTQTWAIHIFILLVVSTISGQSAFHLVSDWPSILKYLLVNALPLNFTTWIFLGCRKMEKNSLAFFDKESTWLGGGCWGGRKFAINSQSEPKTLGSPEKKNCLKMQGIEAIKPLSKWLSNSCQGVAPWLVPFMPCKEPPSDFL